MKKITLVSAVAAAAFAATAAFSATNVFAADGDTTATTTQTTTQTTGTTGHVKLNATEDGSDNGTPEKITLDAAPGFDFGSKKLDANGVNEGASFSATSFTDKGNVLQVTNPGLPTGWTVTASASDFTDPSTKKTLKGAEFTLGAGNTTLNNDNNNKATATGITFKTDAQTVFTAAAGAGVGINTNTYALTDANLTVPAGNTKGDYTANITWTLTDSVPTAK